MATHSDRNVHALAISKTMPTTVLGALFTPGGGGGPSATIAEILQWLMATGSANTLAFYTHSDLSIEVVTVFETEEI